LERLLLAELERHGVHLPGAERATPVIIQSFSPESLRILRHELATEFTDNPDRFPRAPLGGS
jgi:hypothetical protein